MVRKVRGRAESLPLFAQAVNAGAARVASGAKPTLIRPLALIGLPLAVGGLLLFVARPDRAQSRPGGTTATSAVTASAPVSIDAAAQPDKARHDLSYYVKDVRPNLFSAPVPPPPVVKKVVAPKPPPVYVPPVEPVDPFADFSYTGTVTINGEMQALIENTKNDGDKASDYYKVGDKFQGAEITRITDDMVSLNLNGTEKQLSKSDNFVTTPLDTTAAGPPQGPQGVQITVPAALARRLQMMQQRMNGGGPGGFGGPGGPGGFGGFGGRGGGGFGGRGGGGFGGGGGGFGGRRGGGGGFGGGGGG